MSTGPSNQPAEPSSVRLAGTLAFAGLLSGLAIVTTYELTLPRIEANKAEALRQAVFQVLPGSVSMQKLVASGEALVPAAADDKAEGIYAAYDPGGQFVGYAVPGEGAGFQDTIRLLYGLAPAGDKVVGMAILESRETPGLGDKIFKDPVFVGAFSALQVDPKIAVVPKGTRSAPNEVDAITGATISSKAVVKIINVATERWRPRLPVGGPPPIAAPGGT